MKLNDIHDDKVRNDLVNIFESADLTRYAFNYPDNYLQIQMSNVIDYIVKLEREVCGLREYKKHQDRANERRFHSSDEPWHRGSIIAKKK